VNFLEYWEHAPDGSVIHFAWVTNLPMTHANLMTLMRGARARWKIENETFNTLKNQGCHFEHNFGHGRERRARSGAPGRAVSSRHSGLGEGRDERG
jgi:hypothetical protein